MAQVIKTEAQDTIHTIQLTERELSIITALLGQVAYGETHPMFELFKRTLTKPRVMVENPGGIPAIRFKN